MQDSHKELLAKIRAIDPAAEKEILELVEEFSYLEKNNPKIFIETAKLYLEEYNNHRGDYGKE